MAVTARIPPNIPWVANLGLLLRMKQLENTCVVKISASLQQKGQIHPKHSLSSVEQKHVPELNTSYFSKTSKWKTFGHGLDDVFHGRFCTLMAWARLGFDGFAKGSNRNHARKTCLSIVLNIYTNAKHVRKHAGDVATTPGIATTANVVSSLFLVTGPDTTFLL